MDLAPLSAQEAAPPVLRAGSGADAIEVDGVLNEPSWAAADMVDGFAQPSRATAPRRRIAPKCASWPDEISS